jgi:hypothetical protein
MGDRLVVGLRTLTPSAGVRIPLPQPPTKKPALRGFFCGWGRGVRTPAIDNWFEPSEASSLNRFSDSGRRPSPPFGRSNPSPPATNKKARLARVFLWLGERGSNPRNRQLVRTERSELAESLQRFRPQAKPAFRAQQSLSPSHQQKSPPCAGFFVAGGEGSMRSPRQRAERPGAKRRASAVRRAVNPSQFQSFSRSYPKVSAAKFKIFDLVFR